MRAHEIINEIITVHTLLPLTDDKKELIQSITDTYYKDDVYYGFIDSTLVVSTKVNNVMTSCAVCVKFHNPKFSLVSNFYVPKNMYSWVKDGGSTTNRLIKAIIQISEIPVMSDIEMTPYAKKSIQAKIEKNIINAKIFNICNGQIMPYDKTIWEKDDDCRVIFFEHAMGKPNISKSLSSKLLSERIYNWRDIMNNTRWKYRT